MAPPNDEESGLLVETEDDTHPDAPIEPAAPRLNGFDNEEDDSPPTPRFIQDQGEYRHWKWLPSRLRHFGRKVKHWCKGPQPPRIHTIEPWFPAIQEAPIQLLDRYLPKRRQKIALLAVFYLCWILTFGLVMGLSSLSSEVGEYGMPYKIGCGSTFWTAGNSCGLDGNNCRPFENSNMAFVCPGECASRWVLNPRAVGAQEINYRPFIIGGPPEDHPEEKAVYRGDSFICGAAVHAGVIDKSTGGCGVVSLVGRNQNYSSTTRHGITSIGFDSYFPQTLEFKSGISCKIVDPRWSLLIVSLLYTIPISVFTSSSLLFFWTIFTGIFIHVGFASDPPNHSSITGLASNLIGKFLPAAFCAFVIYRYCVKRTLFGMKAHIEKTILWLGGCWLGALSNYTLDWIPIQRLNAHDLKQQPGAPLALAIIILILLGTVVQQIRNFRVEGRLPKYLAIYGMFVGAILLSLALPGLNLRIHHYILGLLLLPGTSMQTRPALLYQGLLVGLFINGIARWGFDSVLQTSSELQGDAQHNSALPILLEPVISLGMTTSNISFSWSLPPVLYDGFSVLVNDVERFRGFVDQGYGVNRSWVWERERGLNVPEYFRFGYMSGNQGWDYSRAATWLADGSWIDMEPGPSRVKRWDFRNDLQEERIVL